MSNIHSSVTSLIGHTPLLDAKRFVQMQGLEGELLVKLEYANPAGSVKDRVALGIIRAAEAAGQLAPGGTIIEATSGNTGIGLCALGAALGYRVLIVMPETMSIERRRLMQAYGGELILTEGAKGMRGAIEKAESLLATIPGAVAAEQFRNVANAMVHETTTGPEIWEDTDGHVDVLVAGVGTGGTITGTGRYLKQHNPTIHVVAVEPKDSPVLSKGMAGPHTIQGIGAGFVPEVLDTTIYDEVMTVAGEEAMDMARLFGRTEGILVGISSGAALAAAVALAKRPAYKGKRIVAILADNGERYLSTALYAMAEETKP